MYKRQGHSEGALHITVGKKDVFAADGNVSFQGTIAYMKRSTCPGVQHGAVIFQTSQAAVGNKNLATVVLNVDIATVSHVL